MNSISLALVARSFYSQAWAVTPGMYDVLETIVLERLDGYKPSTEEIKARVNGTTYGSSDDVTTGGGIALINLHGVLMSRVQAMESLSGGSTPQRFASLLRQAADNPEVGTIVVSVDSPGGAISGTGVAAEAVAYAASQKRTIAVVDDSAYSAAYWLASQASEIVVPESGGVGSISVIMAHMDRREQYAKAGVRPTVLRTGANKALGQSAEALTPEVRSKLQGEMQKYHDLFVAAVAAGRGQTAAYVQEHWADGSTWIGQAAVDAGLADRIGTLASVMAELKSGAPAPSLNMAAQAQQPAPPGTSAPLSDPAPTEPPLLNQGAAASESHQEEPMNIKDISAKLAAGTPLTPEDNAFLQAHLAANPSAQAPAVDTSSWPAEARSAFEGLNTRMAQTEERAGAAERAAAAERDVRLNAHFLARAQALGQPTEFAATLRAAHDTLSKEHYDDFEAALTRGAAASGRLLQEQGNAAPRASGDPISELDARAKTLIAADTRLSLAAAQKQVFEADAAFAAQYQQALRR